MRLSDDGKDQGSNCLRLVPYIVRKSSETKRLADLPDDYFLTMTPRQNGTGYGTIYGKGRI